MNNYEAMCIITPDLGEDERKAVCTQVHEVISKNQGTVASGTVWAERRKLYFPLKRHLEGFYYLVNFSISPEAIKELHRAFKLNENILRVLITRLE